MADRDAVEAALAGLRPSLAADGFELRVGGWPTETTVDVVLAALPDACLDCLVPDGMLVLMIEDAIRRQNFPIEHVNLVKEGFEDAASH